MKWDKIREDWESNNIPLQKLADKHGVTLSAVKSRKSREQWGVATKSRNQDEKLQPKKKKVATKKNDEKKVVNEGIVKNKKRGGNPNPKNQFTKRNTAAVKHGLRSRYIHEEQIEIMEAMKDFDIADQLWLQIELSFAAIIRAQKIMWVDDIDDHLKETSGWSTGDGGSSKQYKLSYAYERYEAFIKAQTRAFSEHRNLVKQFMELSSESDERRLKIEQMQLNVEKTKKYIELTKIAISKENSEEEEQEDDGFMDALNHNTNDVWSD